MFAQLSRSRHTEPNINGPSRGRGTWFETAPRPRHIQALGTVVATAAAAVSSSKVSMPAVAIPKATAFNFSFLDWTWRPISFRKQLQSVYVYVSAIATPM